MSQYHHLQGEISDINKLYRHYHGLFGFMAVKDSDIFTNSPNPYSSLRIKNALRWFYGNYHLYSFSLHTITHVKPSFINPTLLENQNIPLETVLEDETAGMAFPLDATPLYRGEPILDPTDKAGYQFPKPECEFVSC